LLGSAEKTVQNSSEVLAKALQKALGKIENHHMETLTDSGKTSPSNNTSTILLLELADGKKFLLTGDAGMPAMEYAYGEFVALGYSARSLHLMQVPHHGSRKNSGPSILDKFLGERTTHPDTQHGVAFVSVGTTCDKDGHPFRVVTNAFKRRGYPVWQTRGSGVQWGFDRIGWSPVAALPLYESVESDD
jgi:beta-lactamase superfamily II metal-dependent hydrolase